MLVDSNPEAIAVASGAATGLSPLDRTAPRGSLALRRGARPPLSVATDHGAVDHAERQGLERQVVEHQRARLGAALGHGVRALGAVGVVVVAAEQVAELVGGRLGAQVGQEADAQAGRPRSGATSSPTANERPGMATPPMQSARPATAVLPAAWMSLLVRT